MTDPTTVPQSHRISPTRHHSILQRLVDARVSGIVYAAAMFFGYCVIPLVVQFWVNDYAYLDSVAYLAFVSAVCILLGAAIPIFDPMLPTRHARFAVNERVFLWCVWGGFAAFAFLAWATAERIPIIAAIQGADPATLAELRERFLKAREGWQQSFVYINALFTGAILPYCVARMFAYRLRGRWIALFFFFAYSISFLEKAYFLKVLIPLFYLVATRKIESKIRPGMMLMLLVGIVGMMAFVSGAGESGIVTTESFFSPHYQPTGPINHMIWRIVSIPVVTAADGLRLFMTQFGGDAFFGATSSLLAAITSEVRVPFEQLVFALQWGQNATGTGSANAVFIIEAYVNFGIVGVIVFSLIVGVMLRMLAKSKDPAAEACWLLLGFGLYTAGLIGVLLSNGFLLLFVLILFVRLRPGKTRAAKV